MNAGLCGLILFLLASTIGTARAQFTYITNNGAPTLVGYVTQLMPSSFKTNAVDIPSSVYGMPVTAIRSNALWYYGGNGPASLSLIANIPDTVTNIGEQAFWSCGPISRIVMGTGVVNIGNSAFAGDCYYLTNLVLGSSNLVYIGVGAFSSCNRLTNLVIGASVKTMGKGAFWSAGLTNLLIPDSVSSIGIGTFANATSLLSATMGAGVTDMGSNVFDQCSSLKSVYFKGNAPSLAGPTLSQTNVFTIYYLPGTTGWGASFGGAQTVLWNSQPKNPTIQTNGFAFSIVGSSNPVIVVEVSTNLTNPSWFPVATNSLVSGSSNFNDTSWTNRAVSFYRVRSQ